jgi:hypothetical protein
MYATGDQCNDMTSFSSPYYDTTNMSTCNYTTAPTRYNTGKETPCASRDGCFCAWIDSKPRRSLSDEYNVYSTFFLMHKKKKSGGMLNDGEYPTENVDSGN